MAKRPFINHVEMAYRPGQKEAARAFFQVLGFHVVDTDPWLTIFVDPEATDNWADNVMYCQEAIPAQQAFEDEFARVLESDGELAASLKHYKEIRRTHPQFTFHFGASIPTHEDWQERVDRLREAGENHPLLAGHVEVMAFEPGVENAISTQSQAFVRTDIMVAEGYPFGLEMELQYTPVDEAGNSNAQQTGYMPDLAADLS